MSNLSFKWPVNNGRMTSTFAESRSDHYHDGIDIVCSDDKIYTTDSGKLLFAWDKSLFPLENHPGGGNYKVISHGDKCSVYMHMENGFPIKKSYSENEFTGIIGNTGHSFAKHLHFSVLDLKQKKSINPLLLLPLYPDKKSPDVRKFFFKIDDKYIMLRYGSKIRLTKHYPLLVNIVDTITGREKLGIYKLKVFHNSKPVLDAVFKELFSTKEGLAVQTKIFSELIDEKSYYIVKGIRYVQGENKFRIQTSDFAGNETVKSFLIDVNLDM